MSDRVSAVVALFSSADALLKAISEIKGQNLGKLEAYTPYPVHGLNKALAIKRSPLGIMVFAMGLIGAVSALVFQWWTSAVDYPVRVGGKALFSWQAFVPIIFEVMVLFAAFTAGLGMLFLLNRLPWFGHPMLRSRAIAACTRDRFALSIESANLDVTAARAALKRAGGSDIELLNPLDAPGEEPVLVPLMQGAGIVGACVAAGLLTFFGIKWFPVLPPMNQMEIQPKAVAYRTSEFFGNRNVMRLPVEGTVARGHLPLVTDDPEKAGVLMQNPVPSTKQVFARGKARYETFCQVCHGALGDGKGSLSEAYEAEPSNFHSSTLREYPDGQIFHVISEGYGSMPAYGAELPVDDRWAVVHYVRALQRAMNAKEEDLP